VGEKFPKGIDLKTSSLQRETKTRRQRIKDLLTLSDKGTEGQTHSGKIVGVFGVFP